MHTPNVIPGTSKHSLHNVYIHVHTHKLSHSSCGLDTLTTTTGTCLIKLRSPAHKHALMDAYETIQQQNTCTIYWTWLETRTKGWTNAHIHYLLFTSHSHPCTNTDFSVTTTEPTRLFLDLFLMLNHLHRTNTVCRKIITYFSKEAGRFIHASIWMWCTGPGITFRKYFRAVHSWVGALLLRLFVDNSTKFQSSHTHTPEPKMLPQERASTTRI